MAPRSSHLSPGLPSRFFAAFIVLFLLGPIFIAGIVAFSSGNRLEFPIPGFSLRWFATALAKPQYIEGLTASIIIGVGNAIFATIAGTGAALALNHYRFRGRSLIQALVMLPIALDVNGLSLLAVSSIPSVSSSK